MLKKALVTAADPSIPCAFVEDERRWERRRWGM